MLLLPYFFNLDKYIQMEKGRLGSQSDKEKESDQPGGSEASLTKPFIPGVLVAGCQVGANGGGCLLSASGIVQAGVVSV